MLLLRSSSGRKILWQEMLLHELLEALRQNPVVIVPVGSVEQHGPHCPQDVDISIPYHLAIQTAAATDDFPVIVGSAREPGICALLHGRGWHDHAFARDVHRGAL